MTVSLKFTFRAFVAGMSFNMKVFRVLFLLLVAFESVFCESKLKLVREWKEMEFMFPDDNSRLDAETRKHYTRGESVPIDVDVYYSQSISSSFILYITAG